MAFTLFTFLKKKLPNKLQYMYMNYISGEKIIDGYN